MNTKALEIFNLVSELERKNLDLGLNINNEKTSLILGEILELRSKLFDLLLNLN